MHLRKTMFISDKDFIYVPCNKYGYDYVRRLYGFTLRDAKTLVDVNKGYVPILEVYKLKPGSEKLIM